ncbi:FAD-dependent monooxygenase [Streptomyces sp. NPDC001980]|uniref:FAD-dependent monooxygenase n=1 Tax=Streptomyces sp. NPDC001980 TaxID=3157126 RepID=UPI0033320F9F
MNEPTPNAVHTTTTDVLITGAGPVGLALACDLARRGVGFRLVERSATPSTASRAKTVQPRALEVADDLGIIERVLVQGATNILTRHYDRDRVASEAVELAGGTPTPDAPYPPVWLSRPKFEQILRDRLVQLGGTIHWATEVTGLRPDSAPIDENRGGGA